MLYQYFGFCFFLFVSFISIYIDNLIIYDGSEMFVDTQSTLLWLVDLFDLSTPKLLKILIIETEYNEMT